MTRLEAIEEEIRKLSPEEVAELRQWLERETAAPAPPLPPPSKDGKYTSEDIHRFLFPDGPPEPRTLEELKQKLEDAINEKYALP